MQIDFKGLCVGEKTLPQQLNQNKRKHANPALFLSSHEQPTRQTAQAQRLSCSLYSLFPVSPLILTTLAKFDQNI
jgi:hypothetical protein